MFFIAIGIIWHSYNITFKLQLISIPNLTILTLAFFIPFISVGFFNAFGKAIGDSPKNSLS